MTFKRLKMSVEMIKDILSAKKLMNGSIKWDLLAHKGPLWDVLMCTDTPALLTGPEELKLGPEENTPTHIQTGWDTDHKSYLV